MLLVGRYIKKMDPHADCHQFCLGVSAHLRSHYGKRQMERMALHPEERLTCSAIVFSRLQRQIWMVGDCQCLVDGQLFDNPKPAEAVHAAKRAARVRHLLDQGVTVDQLLDHDAARDIIIPDIVASMKQQNISYAVIDGFPIAERHVKVMTLDFQPHQIVLASDGYPFLRPTLDESEALLRRQQATDPLNIDTFVACKAFMHGQDSFDDRSYIRFDV